MTDDAKRLINAIRAVCAEQGDCDNCPKRDYCYYGGDYALRNNAADLIESLAAELEQVKQERDGLNILLAQAQSMLETRTRERDAAVEDIPRACGYCKHYEEYTNQCTNSLPCACVSGINTRWQ